MTISKKFRITHNPTFRYFASIRFAIPVLFALVLCMVAGTVFESLYGTNYASNAVYTTWWFYLVQGCIAASVILAVIDRIPFRKKLTGFYTVHAGIVILLIGAVVTRLWGVDGSLELDPARFNSAVRLSEDFLYLSHDGGEYSLHLPRAVSPVGLNKAFQLGDGTKVVAKEFLPYAKETREWRPEPGLWVSKWRLKNDRFEQVFDLANRAIGDIADRNDMGLLHVEAVDSGLWGVLKEGLADESKVFLLWNEQTKKVDLLGSLEKSATLRDAQPGAVLRQVHHPKVSVPFYQLTGKSGGANFAAVFFPKYSAAPVTKSLEPDFHSPYRLISLEEWRKKSTVLFTVTKDAGSSPKSEIQVGFGKGLAWSFQSYQSGKLALPWMGFSLELMDFRRDQAPVPAYERGVPSPKEERNIRAVRLEMERQGKREQAWITDRAAAGLEGSGITGIIGKETMSLPFEFRLNRFKMDQVPGSDKPASYESFVEVRPVGATGNTIAADSKNPVVHVYMNNPYKRDGFTFYQSSYFQDEQGQYHSVFSVNRDPGRWIKYLGSIVLIVGFLVHLLIIYGVLPLGGGKKGQQLT